MLQSRIAKAIALLGLRESGAILFSVVHSRREIDVQGGSDVSGPLSLEVDTSEGNRRKANKMDERREIAGTTPIFFNVDAIGDVDGYITTSTERPELAHDLGHSLASFDENEPSSLLSQEEQKSLTQQHSESRQAPRSGFQAPRSLKEAPQHLASLQAPQHPASFTEVPQHPATLQDSLTEAPKHLASLQAPKHPASLEEAPEHLASFQQASEPDDDYFKSASDIFGSGGSTSIQDEVDAEMKKRKEEQSKPVLSPMEAALEHQKSRWEAKKKEKLCIAEPERFGSCDTWPPCEHGDCRCEMLGAIYDLHILSENWEMNQQTKDDEKRTSCKDNPSWTDVNEGDGSTSCANLDTADCTPEDENDLYAIEAREACPVRCGTCPVVGPEDMLSKNVSHVMDMSDGVLKARWYLRNLEAVFNNPEGKGRWEEIIRKAVMEKDSFWAQTRVTEGLASIVGEHPAPGSYVGKPEHKHRYNPSSFPVKYLGLWAPIAGGFNNHVLSVSLVEALFPEAVSEIDMDSEDPEVIERSRDSFVQEWLSWIGSKHEWMYWANVYWGLDVAARTGAPEFGKIAFCAYSNYDYETKWTKDGSLFRLHHALIDAQAVTGDPEEEEHFKGGRPITEKNGQSP